MKLFWLERTEDISGITGLGVVAEGVEFTNGRCALTWLQSTDATIRPSYGIYESLQDIEKIHGHKGTTKIIFQLTEGHHNHG